jgi:hypothetical protein
MGQKFSFHLFLCTKGLRIVIANGTGHERIVNIKYCICRDRGMGDEDVQIKLEILKPRSHINNLARPQVPISLQGCSHSLAARLPPP